MHREEDQQMHDIAVTFPAHLLHNKTPLLPLSCEQDTV
jgi:hypothetical protein